MMLLSQSLHGDTGYVGQLIILGPSIRTHTSSELVQF
jgi:hypothetical protein